MIRYGRFFGNMSHGLMQNVHGCEGPGARPKGRAHAGDAIPRARLALSCRFGTVFLYSAAILRRGTNARIAQI